MRGELYLIRSTDVLGEERKRYLDSAREQTFTSATVLGDPALSWRRADVCFTWPLMAEMREQLRRVLMVEDDKIVDLQLTRSGEGDYFKRHQDNNWPETAERKTTFVYYLGDRATFTCGRLLFPDHGVSVEPLDDSLVVFGAGEWHEIEVVRPRGEIYRLHETRSVEMTKRRSPARYTLNGWLR